MSGQNAPEVLYLPSPETIRRCTEVLRPIKLAGRERVDDATAASIARVHESGSVAEHADLAIDPEPPRPTDITFELLKDARSVTRRQPKPAGKSCRQAIDWDRIFDVHVPQLIDEGLVTPRAIASRLLADGVVPSASKHLRYAITRELRSRGIEVACVRPRPWDYAAVRRSAWTHDYDPAYDGPRETLPRDVARFIQRIPEAEDDDPAVESEQLSAETVDDPPAAVDAEAAVDDPSPEDPATRLPVEGEPPAEESAAGPSSDPDRLPAWLVERLSLAWDLVEVAGDVATAARAISAVAALCDLES